MSNRDDDYREGVEKLKEIVAYLNSTGILDSVLDFVSDEEKVRSFLRSSTYRAIVEMLGTLKDMIDRGEVDSEDFTNGLIAIAKHLDKIGKVITILDKNGVLDVITSGLSKAAEAMVRSNRQSNIVEFLASLDDPDVKKTLAYLRYMLKELGSSAEPVLNNGQQK
ncbi:MULTISPECIES: hypothetical protein [Metallosphaera]|uniref:DUF1641 domain-containing protein n=3 Tax=Metallosphaera TaxID=41980 RepID=A4YF95_METS5|nr:MULTISPECIES: hypothetical protein [Metallosphaera]ABP95097.1 hypothetical protein Msed_0925 [Metallosphaera sedula DSM 5348]AIM27083.1 hypothetical protein HA72_0925 [Metallosphaera sedula]AKV73996.1 hypothetical protein MsedA_0941 [Metallosphaera sedula]AKV76235.1 hypothetical protein MsedB_0942 [Metallosphaera sedula]AKV78488.1 hypothetical protein MsedC_0941 [Metallosphaera sedula]